MNKLVGYARVSKGEQNLNLQIDALKKQGVKNNIFSQTKFLEQKKKELDSANVSNN